MAATKPGLGEKGLIILFVAYFISRFLDFTWAAIFIVACIGGQLIYLHYLNGVWKRVGIPGPPPKLYFGNITETFSEGISAVDTKWTKKYGKVFGTYFMTQPSLVISDVELLKQILVKDFHNFTNRRDVGAGFSSKNSLFSKIITMIKDDEWKNVRNTITPAFTSGKIKHMAQLVDDCVDTLMEILSEHAAKNEPFHLQKRFGGCAMDIIAATAFGQKVDSQRNPDNPFVKYAKEVQTFNFKGPKYILAVMFPWIANQLRLHFDIRFIFVEAEDFFTRTLTQLITERRKNPLTEKPDFLQLLLNASDNQESIQEDVDDEMITHDIGGKREPLTNLQIMSQSFIFLVAGYDTTANTLTFISYMLALNPEEQEKCYKEILSVAGEKGHITYDHIHRKTPYLDAVIAETLRIFPPAVRFDRQCREEYKLDGYTIPKDAWVNISAYVIHHDEENYPEPERFLPERFLPEEKAKRNPYVYLPFGYGPRNCIGMRFAQMEMKLVLANLIRKFKLIKTEQTEAYPPKFDTKGNLRPLNPMFLKVETR